MRTKALDLTEINVNIDNLIDVYVETQKEHGVDVGMKEVDVMIDDDGKVIRDKFGHHNDKKPKKKEGESCKGCTESCEKKPKKESEIPWYMINHMGLFGEDASDELDDDEDNGDDTYVCGYCSDIGYRKEYKPYLCDSCHSCESCSEYNAGDCDGCSYSVYRTGEYYSDVLARQNGEKFYLEEDERELIASIEEGDFDEEDLRNVDCSFTVMNYEHKYGK